METRKKRIRYTLDDAVSYVLAPGSDSELSELECEEDESYVDSNTVTLALEKEKELTEWNKENEIANEELIASTSTGGPKSKENNQKAGLKPKEKFHEYRWRNRECQEIDATFTGPEFSLAPEDFEQLTPLWYFKQFWDDGMNSHLAHQTNLYSVQVSGSSIATSKQEIEQLIGIQMRMGIVKMPNIECYWAAESRYAPVADVMSLKRYKKLRQFLHANDNHERISEENKDDKLYKVRPILASLRENCRKVEQEEYMSIDEQIVPAKTKYSGIRQYNAKKPHKWGFKNFVRAGQSGMIYDFFFYTGVKSSGNEKCTTENVVLRLVENVPRDMNFKIFYDNWFSSLDLGLKLKDLGILTVSTIRCNRLGSCQLPTDKKLQHEGRGSVCSKTDVNSGTVVLKWYDNKCVHLTSTFMGGEVNGTVKRWDRSTKSHIEVPCPSMVKMYNKAMGGVDLADMLIALYRCKVKTKRWYLLLLFHCVDIAKVNGWLLYRRFCAQANVPARKQLSLLQFVSQTADALIYAAKPRGSAGRPKRCETELQGQEAKKGRRSSIPLPSADSRFDGLHHWAEFRETKNRCKLCKTGYSRVYCEKCSMCLCLSASKNCFKAFHTA